MALTTTDGRPIEIIRNEALRQFIGRVGDVPATIVEFMLTPDLVIFTHTETHPDFEGQGVATVVVRHALADARNRGYAVLPLCSFVKAFMTQHPDEYVDLLYQPPESAK
jgi:predicted GNAT family acetyltransferase